MERKANRSGENEEAQISAMALTVLKRMADLEVKEQRGTRTFVNEIIEGRYGKIWQPLIDYKSAYAAEDELFSKGLITNKTNEESIVESFVSDKGRDLLAKLPRA